MATIRLNDHYVYNAIWGNGSYSWLVNWRFTAAMHVLKGSVPNQATLNGYTDPASSRSSDILITWSQIVPSTPQSIFVVDNRANSDPSYVYIRNNIDTPAVASGTASWFWIYRSLAGQHYSVIGSIGTPGSGADVLINNTSIIASQNYRTDEIKFTFPVEYTF